MRTEFSATLFGGDPSDWVRYLSRSAEARCEAHLGGVVSQGPSLEFVPDNQESVWFCAILTSGVRHLRDLAKRKTEVDVVLTELLSQAARSGIEVSVGLSRSIPVLATREVTRTSPGEARIVINRGLMCALREALNVDGLSLDEGLGLMWPLIVQIVGHLGFPSDPRSRYTAKIDVTARLAYVAVNVLYENGGRGDIVPSPCGETVESLVAAANDQERKWVRERDGYLRLLHKIAFARRARPYAHYERDLRIAAREYVDSRYLRLSLSGAMPALEEWRRPLAVDTSRRKPRVDAPKVGHYGVVGDVDLEAWHEVETPLREVGFTLLRQVGVGDFGRVYEAYNHANPEYPERVAIKVDKIIGKKSRAILDAELAMEVGRELAAAPHLIRLYDTGKVSGRRFTYHVLQLVDGETLDGLVGSAELEHESIPAPPARRLNLAELRRDLAQRMGFGADQVHGKALGAIPFRFGLSPAMLMDLLTDVLLCLEEVHDLGYAMNDLKNDNVMVSRRGQIKGIDLDSFSRVHTALDKYTDFIFLAAALVIVVLHAQAPAGQGLVSDWRELVADEVRLRAALGKAWPAAAVEDMSEGRVAQSDLVTILGKLISRSNGLHYANDPSLFSGDISELVSVKQRLLLEDFVID